MGKTTKQRGVHKGGINCHSEIRNQKSEFKTRTKEFAKRIVRLCRTLPTNREGRLIGDQLFRCGTSVAANYRAACRGRSTAEFVSKLSIVEEEADESMFWMELLSELNIIEENLLTPLMNEANEILSITIASIKTARRNNNGKR